MNRRQFVRTTAFAASALALAPSGFAGDAQFPVVRRPESKRRFKSVAVERAIEEVQSKIGNKELAWMFGNCFPNTLDTTVDFEMVNGRPDTLRVERSLRERFLQRRVEGERMEERFHRHEARRPRTQMGN